MSTQPGTTNLERQIRSQPAELERLLASPETRGQVHQAAEALHREAVDGAARSLPAERPENGLFLTGLGRTLQKEKRYADAADAYAKARVNLVAAYGPTHERVVRLTEMQTALYKEWGRPLPSDPH